MNVTFRCTACEGLREEVGEFIERVERKVSEAMTVLSDTQAAVQALSDKIDALSAAVGAASTGVAQLATDSAAANQAVLDEIARVEALITAGAGDGISAADAAGIITNLQAIATKTDAVTQTATAAGAALVAADTAVTGITAEAAAERPQPRPAVMGSNNKPI